MPLFFFLAGYLLNSESIKLGLFSFARRLYLRIVIPYLFFWIISYPYWLAIQSIQKKSESTVHLSFYDPFIGILYGINEYLYPNVVLWFFTCLYTTSLIFYLYYKFIGRRLLIPTAAALSLIAAYVFNEPSIRLPWNIDVALVVVFFFAVGYFSRDYKVIDKLVHSRRGQNVLGFLLCSFVLYFTAKYNGVVFISSAIFQNPIIFFVAALIGILMVIYISHTIPRNRYCEWLSSNTMILFSLHQLFFSIFAGIGIVIFGLHHEFNERPIIYISYVVLAIILSIPSSFILKRYFPWSLGIKVS